MAKIILYMGPPERFKAVVRNSNQCDAIASLKYLTALHSSEGLKGNIMDPNAFRLGLHQIKPGISYFKAIGYWNGEIHPGEYDLATHVDNAGLSEHLGGNLRKKPRNYVSPLRT